ncbi:MAG: ATP-binding cassette domain-containing protein [Chloroflexi bacterium]|uniref:ATP-binding cassette domain-containing protein n=1 Tax=Candidatus Flexifilum breve TaxID=3140694 RepID=UPI0031356452|nr:ATP-binding cassette domain-containing protein [Chloroflexota bacterium]
MVEDNRVLEVNGLQTYFQLDEGLLKAVDGVDLTIREKTTVGIIGESGCGKSVTAQSILRCSASGRIGGGQIRPLS